MPDWKAVVRARVQGIDVDDEVVDEVSEHVEEMVRNLTAAGHSAVDSRAAVERELADIQAVIDAARSNRLRRAPRLPAVEPPSPGRLKAVRVFARDCAHGVRLLIARPGFTAVAVLTLALGVGANTAIFSVIQAVLLDPLPFPESDRLVMMWERNATDPDDIFIVSAPNYRDWAARARSFESTAIWEYKTFNIAGDGEPEQVPGMRISASVFPMLRVAPQLGRVFTPAEDLPGNDVVVISDSLWRRRYSSRRDIIGQDVRLNGRPFEIVGVMPPEFRFTQDRHAIWVPIHFTDRDGLRDAHSFTTAARLVDGVDYESAKAELEAIGRQLSSEYEENHDESATITRLDELGVRSVRTTLLMLQGAVVLVALIACVNVANLLLAQASIRQREFSIRRALGAGSGRLAGQILAEGLVLALAGGAAGALLAWASTSAMASQLPASIKFAPFRAAGSIPIHAGTLAFTFALALVTGIVFSLAPMLAATRSDPGAALKSGDRGGTSRLPIFRNALMAVEVALAVVVLAGAGLMIKSVGRLMAIDPGLDASNVLLMDIALPQADTYGQPQRTTFCQDVQREVGSLPGVVAAGAISHLPLSGANAGRGFAIDGRSFPPQQGPNASYRLTCPGYFTTLGIRMVRGRDFTHADATSGQPVAIINETAAATYWPNADPIGSRIKLGDINSNSTWMIVVGVSADVRHFGLDATPRRELFRPYSQAAWPVMTIAVKSASEPLGLATSVRASLRRIDPDQPVSRVRTMEQVVAESVGLRRFPMLLLALFAAVALVLSAVGVYGVVSYVVSQRTREIGIRMALGAKRATVIRLVVTRAAVPIVIGVVAGAIGARLASRQLTGLLFEVAPSDPSVLTAIAVLLGVVALAASWIPATRAASVDPVVVLRA